DLGCCPDIGVERPGCRRRRRPPHQPNELVVPDGGDMPAYFHSGFDAPTGGLGRAGTSQQDLASLSVDSQLVPGMAGRDGAGPDLGAGMNVSPPLPRALAYADGERGG